MTLKNKVKCPRCGGSGKDAFTSLFSLFFGGDLSASVCYLCKGKQTVPLEISVWYIENSLIGKPLTTYELCMLTPFLN